MKWIYFILFSIALGLSFYKPKSLLKGDHLIVWSVGQGQMVTYVSKNDCYHFDMGGEYFPKKKLFKICSHKKNRVYYSHFDSDHINFSLKAKKILPSLCRHPSSAHLRLSQKKQAMIQKIPVCSSEKQAQIDEIILPPTVHPKNSNESSRIFVIKKIILIPGDSTKRMEKHWAPLAQKFPIQVLIVGHHGSRSSTSLWLLKHIPDLKIAVSSARRKRYGHPHPSTVQKLRKSKALFLNVEDFGHIAIPLGLSFLRAFPF